MCLWSSRGNNESISIALVHFFFNIFCARFSSKAYIVGGIHYIWKLFRKFCQRWCVNNLSNINSSLTDSHIYSFIFVFLSFYHCISFLLYFFFSPPIFIFYYSNILNFEFKTYIRFKIKMFYISFKNNYFNLLHNNVIVNISRRRHI